MGWPNPEGYQGWGVAPSACLPACNTGPGSGASRLGWALPVAGTAKAGTPAPSGRRWTRVSAQTATVACDNSWLPKFAAREDTISPQFELFKLQAAPKWTGITSKGPAVGVGENRTRGVR